MNTKTQLIVTTSWDDGSIFDLKVAELLSKYKIKGTFYIPQKLFAHPLTRQNILEIDKEHEIGAHTLNHVRLSEIPIEVAKGEILGSKKYLDELLGHEVAMFSYPVNKYNSSIVKLVKESGFSGARTANHGGFSLPHNVFEWPVTMLASDRSPLQACKVCAINRLDFKSIMDWEMRAKRLFEKALNTGGIFHIYGHSLEIEIALQWDKLENVLKYITNTEGVIYMTNGEILPHLS